MSSESQAQGEPHKQPPSCEEQRQGNLGCKECNIDLQLDLDKANRPTLTNENKKSSCSYETDSKPEGFGKDVKSDQRP